MHAIGHYVLDHNPAAKVVYLSSEKFTNEFINSIRDNKAVEFRNKYRNVDVLLIDDIQFLAGKEQTQEEFFIRLIRFMKKASRLSSQVIDRRKKFLHLKIDFVLALNGALLQTSHHQIWKHELLFCVKSKSGRLSYSK